tara:strand:+ start:7838 stop:8266 length:429 start_codon:yes stop_codon:yes gene_type:complete
MLKVVTRNSKRYRSDSLDEIECGKECEYEERYRNSVFRYLDYLKRCSFVSITTYDLMIDEYIVEKITLAIRKGQNKNISNLKPNLYYMEKWCFPYIDMQRALDSNHFQQAVNQLVKNTDNSKCVFHPFFVKGIVDNVHSFLR